MGKWTHVVSGHRRWLVNWNQQNLGLVLGEIWGSIGFCMQSESAGTRVEALPCNACDRQARFLTPYGLKCPDHALMTAIYDEDAYAEGWLPIRIRPPSERRLDRDQR